MPQPHRLLKTRQLTLWPLAMSVFFYVSGGAFGLESVVSQSGAGMAILLILVAPLLWALPNILMSAELSSAIPAEGGYVIWVRDAMGPFAGFLCGWWTWVYSWVDIAIYPVLFLGYVSSLSQEFGFREITLKSAPLLYIGVVTLFVALFALMNIRGAKLVGESSVLFSFLLLTPFAVMVILGLAKYFQHPVPFATPFHDPQKSALGAFSAGLMVVMWNYLGWDALSTVGEEVVEPRKTMPRSLFLALPFVIFAYLLPVGVGLVAYPDASKWQQGVWPEVGRAIGGHWLSLAIGIAALISAMGMFNSTLLASSRIPFVLAEEGYLPAAATRLHPRWGTPWVSILICSLISMGLAMISGFQDLIELDVFIYSAGILLELISLLILRKTAKDLDRPFRIKGGWPVLWAILLVPTAVLGLAVISTMHDPELIEKTRINPIWIGLALIATGPILYPLLKRFGAKASSAL